MRRELKYYLIADGDKNAEFLIERAYERLSLTVPKYFARDGQEVIDYLTGEGEFADRARYPLPAVILLDLKLSRKSGLEVLEWIRESPFKGTVVVVFSTSDLERDVHKAYRLGANSFIRKPTSFTELQGVLSAIHHYWFGYNYIPHLTSGLVGKEKTPFKIVRAH